jgi:hypothetical protein
MHNNKELILKQISNALDEYKNWTYSSKTNQGNFKIYSSLSGIIERLAPKSTMYESNLNLILQNVKYDKIYGDINLSTIENLAGLLESLKTAYENDYLMSIDDIKDRDDIISVI